MKVAICTVGVYNPPLKPEADYVAVTNKIKSRYCEKYGHQFLYSFDNPRPGRKGHWSKFPTLLYALGKLEMDWAVWMDCDAAPVKFDVDIADLLSSMDKDKVVIRKDILGWNSGVFAVPNTVKARQWLALLDNENTHESFKNAPFADQDAIAASFDADEFNDFYQIPPDEFGFNQFDDIYQWYAARGFENEYIPGKHWCLHIAGYGDMFRRIRFTHILNGLDAKMCPVCGCRSNKYFTVDFDKTFYAPKPEMTRQGGMCDYYLCPNCDYIFAPMFKDWTSEIYKERIYNDEYEKYVDPEHVTDDRAKMLFNKFASVMSCNQARHLDYGGGHGQFSKLIHKETGLWSDCYDPFYQPDGNAFKFPSKYSLITAFEVLEHIYDPNTAFADFNRLLIDGGVVLSSTQNWRELPELQHTMPTEWSNIAPRNGHVGMCATKTFEYLAARHGFRYCADKSTGFFQVFEKIRQSGEWFCTGNQ